jgi:HD-GYP domain-containing protein (c-di-GMP phosphodiesterase class II)
MVRQARLRAARSSLERIRRRAFAVSGTSVAAATLATAILVHVGPSFSAPTFVAFLLLYALVSRVTFETGSGYAIPTQLVLVPMLFALPLGLVPLTVGAGFVIGYAGVSWRRRELASLLPPFSTAAHAVGPVLVLALFGGLPLRWSAWPVYLAALAAQFILDFANAVAGELGNRTSPSEIFGYVRIAYAVDAALAPIGLAVAFATHAHTELVVIVLPLILLLRTFAQERKRRIDHALELSDAYRGTAFLLGDVVEADDAYTGSHSRHVVDLVLAVSDQMGLKGSDRRDAEFVALLHDVGKIKIPAEIINKPGPLTAEERKVIETHTIAGQEMLEQVGGLLGHVGDLVRSCHEHWDGRGYPDRLAGPEIPLIARIVCACDAYSAMTTDRPYRKARTADDALDELERCSGSQFDPAVVAAMVTVETRTR